MPDSEYMLIILYMYIRCLRRFSFTLSIDPFFSTLHWYPVLTFHQSDQHGLTLIEVLFPELTLDLKQAYVPCPRT